MKDPFQKGRSELVRVDAKLSKLINEYRRCKYQLEGTWMSRRDVIDTSLNIAGIREAVRRMKRDLKLRGGQ